MSNSGLNWLEWISAIFHIASEALFQRFFARHLPKRMVLPQLAGLTCIVTGATSGIGLETAKQLAEAGAHVVLACRNTAAAEALVEEWHENIDASLKVEVMQLNLLSLSSVRSFCTAWESRNAPLHVLINNAGICSLLAPQKFSEDGYEEHMQVNYLAPALLTLLLLPSLLRCASRIVNVNSDAECFGAVDPDDLNLTSTSSGYSSLIAYAGSKLAQIYFTSILNSHLQYRSGVHAMCVNPGIVTTNVTRTLPKLVQTSHRHSTLFFFNPLEGARSVLFCATAQQALEHANKLRSEGWPLCPLFSSDCKPRIKHIQDQELSKASKVWDRTLELVGLSNDVIEKLLNP
ncbi:hypothetical protein GOP47_0010135 [Adiantum capillus-veneris]|uniref:Uncharacterized protein n=1 Tax=Adiantum capillus-veneris TaxID=13818 RepID=A0A9D4UUQ3_ADICA|nr:hypothetical protein GOP47_0010135 [Adiantum capillus-veneris]